MALTVVGSVAGLVALAVAGDTVDLHPHQRVHDGAAGLPRQLGQLLRRDHLGTAGWGTVARGGGPQEGRGGTWLGVGTGLVSLGEGTWWHMAGCGDGVGRMEVDGATQKGCG